MTSLGHVSGTERLAEVINKNAEPDDAVIVNLQGDEYGMPPALLDQVANLLVDSGSTHMATLCEPLTDNTDYNNPHVVKVILDRTGHALYFSRAAIPWHESGMPADICYRHIGLYAYHAGFLRQYVNLPASALEQQERLEQLRALDHGFRIRIAIASDQPGIGIDTPEDMEQARKSAMREK